MHKKKLIENKPNADRNGGWCGGLDGVCIVFIFSKTSEHAQ